MPVFDYTAQRSLVGVVEAGEPVSYTIKLTQQSPRKQTKRVEIPALGGNKDTLIYNRIRYWDCTTGSLTQTALNELMMFLDSCDNGAPFEMDSVTSELEGDYSVSTVSSKPLYRVSFTVRQVI